ncbi:MAG: hypothetical protein D6775_00235 [Caldilineae bacterium]|nr:MAG: hypothetical protein D6775_00235 [Caldilineae bacterium]
MRRLPRLPELTFPLLIACIFLGLGLRLLHLDFQPLWWDEGYSVWFSGHSLAEMTRLTAADIHPPLYYALMRAWALLLGFRPETLRLLGVLVGLALVPLAYVAGRDLDHPRSGRVAAILVALNPIAIYYSQEIRMYGLATVFSLAALWLGWRLAQEDKPSKRKRIYWLLYIAVALAGLYTLYYFALIPLAQALWVLSKRRHLRRWLAAWAAIGMLYLPWLLYAGPRLLDYVAYKVVKDNDTPLSLFPYLGRHLSAFLVGHLEGPLASFWPWALLLYIPLVVALVWSWRHQENGRVVWRCSGKDRDGLSYLLVLLLLPLAVGFIQQLRAPFVPERFERVLLVAAPALWLLVVTAFRRLLRQSSPAAGLTTLLFLAVTGASLWAFYTTPRYPERDYRPLIATVRENAREGDTVFAIFPWQVGYFWAYLPADQRPDILLSPDESWSPAVNQTLDRLLARGAIWFPEHLALGGILEGQAEQYLDQQSYQLLNRWFGDETRLTAWSRADEALPTSEEPAVPIRWQNGVTLTAAQVSTRTTPDGGLRLFLDLTWQGDAPIVPEHLTFSLWLSDAADFRWAQRDVTPFAHPWPPLQAEANDTWQNRDRIALTVPAGTPPGDYDIWVAILDQKQRPLPTAEALPAPYAWLGAVEIGELGGSPATLPIAVPQQVSGQGIDFLGSSRSLAPLLPGEDLLVHLFWLPREPLRPDRHLFLQLLDGRHSMVAGSEGPPIAWYPTSAWRPRLPLHSQHLLRIPAELAPGRYTLITGLFDPQNGSRLRWQGRDYIELGTVTVLARPHSFTPPTPAHPLNVRLQGGHRLVGYDLVAGDTPGSPVNLVLYWSPAGPTPRHLSTFVHLLNRQDELLDQSDSEPAAGAHPTTSWLQGEYVADVHTLTIPPTAGPGPYHLTLGLYDPATGERLPFLDDTGAIVGDHLVIPIPGR